jgi:DNA-binding YbaB/EbfC family protein
MNQAQLMQQMRKMQQEMVRVQEELANTVVEGTASGGLVTIGITGESQVKKVTIKPDAVDPDDIETLEDLIVVAFNDAIGKVQQLSAAKMGAVTGGLKIPGM